MLKHTLFIMSNVNICRLFIVLKISVKNNVKGQIISLFIVSNSVNEFC